MDLVSPLIIFLQIQLCDYFCRKQDNVLPYRLKDGFSEKYDEAQLII